MLRFLIAMCITALLLLGGGYWFFDALPGFFYQSLILLLVSTIALCRFLVNIRKNKSDLFVPVYLGTLAMKLIAYGAYIFVMAQQESERMAENVVFFMTGYAACTAVETVFLYRVVTR